MIIGPFHYFETGCAAHLLGCGGLGRCAVVGAVGRPGLPARTRESASSPYEGLHANRVLPEVESP